jgi:hypothetical protein
LLLAASAIVLSFGLNYVELAVAIGERECALWVRYDPQDAPPDCRVVIDEANVVGSAMLNVPGEFGFRRGGRPELLNHKSPGFVVRLKIFRDRGRYFFFFF